MPRPVAPPTPAAALTVAALARRLGVAPATLRTWDRRYGLGPTAHVAGERRRYGPEDVARLEVMRRLTHDGVAPGEAARFALADDGARPSEEEVAEGRQPAGRALGAIPAQDRVKGLVRAATALDAAAVTDLVAEGLRRRGVLATWDQLLVPALTAVGARWEATGTGVEVEHLLSECVQAALQSVVPPPVHPANRRPILLAGAPGELHCLPLHALAGGLAEVGIGVRVLGARVPADALEAAVRKSGPAVVFVWSQAPPTAAATPVPELLRLRPPPRLLVGGPGWQDAPAGSQRVYDLAEAVTAVRTVVNV